MKFHTKLFVSLLLIVCVSNGAFLFLAYRYGENTIYREVGSTALSIASTAAVLIDPNVYQNIDKHLDEHSDMYQFYEKELRQVRDSNRRDGAYVNFIYGLFPDAKHPKIQRIGIDAEEHGLDKTKPGTVMRFKSKSGKWIQVDYDKPMVMPEFIEDVWGTWLTALYPIKNDQGKRVGNIRVDMDADALISRFHQLLFTGIAVFFVTILLALLAGWLLMRWFNQPLVKITSALKAISQGNFDHTLEIKTKDEFSEVADVINHMQEGLKQRDMLQASLTRYISHALAEKIVTTGELPELSSERRKVTILICDIRNFTATSEHIKPEEVVEFLNDFFDVVIEAITAEQGILDKYLGDGFLAIFGTPVDDPYQEDHAIKAALKMRELIPALNKKWGKKLNTQIQIGIGINTGSAIVGNIGTDIHMEYTAIGDTVNLASRIENASKDLNADIIVSEYTYISADHTAFQFTEIGEIAVKGRENKVKVYTV